MYKTAVYTLVNGSI